MYDRKRNIADDQFPVQRNCHTKYSKKYIPSKGVWGNRCGNGRDDSY